MVTVDETNRVKGSDPASSAPAGCWPTEGRRGPVERPADQQQRWLGSQLVVFTGSMSYIYVEGMITMRIQPYPGDIKPRNRDDTTSGIWRVWRGVYHPICSFKGETGELYLSTQGIPRLDKRTPLMSVDSSGLILMFDQEPKGLGEKVKRWPPIQIFHDAVSGCLWVELGCSFLMAGWDCELWLVCSHCSWIPTWHILGMMMLIILIGWYSWDGVMHVSSIESSLVSNESEATFLHPRLWHRNKFAPSSCLQGTIAEIHLNPT